MKAKRKLKPTPYHFSGRAAYEKIEQLGLRVVTHRREVENGWHLPGTVIGKDGLSLLTFHEPDKDYSVAGWQCWHDGMFSGRREHFESALVWIERAKAVRAGTAKDFLGV